MLRNWSMDFFMNKEVDYFTITLVALLSTLTT